MTPADFVVVCAAIALGMFVMFVAGWWFVGRRDSSVDSPCDRGHHEWGKWETYYKSYDVYYKRTGKFLGIEKRACQRRVCGRCGYTQGEEIQ